MKKYIIFIMSLLLISCSFEIEKEILMEIIKNIDNDFQNTQIISNVEKNNIDM